MANYRFKLYTSAAISILTFPKKFRATFVLPTRFHSSSTIHSNTKAEFYYSDRYLHIDAKGVGDEYTLEFLIKTKEDHVLLRCGKTQGGVIKIVDPVGRTNRYRGHYDQRSRKSERIFQLKKSLTAEDRIRRLEALIELNQGFGLQTPDERE